MSKVVVRCRLHHGEADEEKPCRVHLHAQLDGGRLHAMAVRQVGVCKREVVGHHINHQPRRWHQHEADLLPRRLLLATVRVRRGIDIDAGCGQLAEEASKEGGRLHYEAKHLRSAADK